jgi:two-component system, LuxR family, sensor kinase FixL
MTASACITLGLIHLIIWCRQRDSWANLLFALAALGTAAFTGFEIAMMRAETPAVFALALRWIHVPGWIVILSLAGFVRLYLKAGRNWLLWSICIVRTVSLILNFLLGQNLNYWEVTHLRHVPFLGESVSIAEGVSNHWMLVGQAAYLLLLIFVVDATLTVWRRGDRRRALIVGGGVIFFVLGATGETTLMLWQLVSWPFIASLPALATISAMAYELTLDAQRASELARELCESEQRLSLAADAANLGIWVWDLARNEIWANDQWRAWFGFGKTEKIDFDRYLEKLHPEDREGVRQTQAKAIGGESHYQTVYRVLLPENRLRWIASRGRIEFNATGKPILQRGVLLDITERRLAELELTQRRNEVAHLSRVTTLGEISGSLAHELNQPLEAILANAEAAEIHLQSEMPNLAELRSILEDIRRDDLRAGEIIHGMRDFLRRRELEMQPLDLGSLAGEVVRLVSADAATRQVTVGLEIPSGLPRVMGDRVHLQQVLVNLLVNAMDAMSTCPVPLRRILIQAAQPNPEAVQISIRDAGTGIPPANVSKVFDPFHTTKPDGLGLGLAICRSIIEMHGGTISLENNLDRGVTARFTLPTYQEPVP